MYVVRYKASKYIGRIIGYIRPAELMFHYLN
jgi:hypothetical protein